MVRHLFLIPNPQSPVPGHYIPLINLLDKPVRIEYSFGRRERAEQYPRELYPKKP